MKTLLSKIDNFLMSKPITITLLIIWVVLAISGILMKFGVDMPIFAEAKLIGRPISNNLVLLWLAFLIYISVDNLKKINKKRDN